MITMRKIVVIVLIIFSGLIALKLYSYFLDRSAPKLMISGLEPGGCYAGDVQCMVNVSKPSDISVWLDNKPIITRFRAHTADADHTLPIPTKAIADGPHVLKIKACDTTYHQNHCDQTCEFVIDNTPLQAALVKAGTGNKVFQGRTLHVQFQTNKQIDHANINALSGSYPCYPESKNSTIYEAFVPVPYEESPNEYPFSIDIQDRVGNRVNIDDKFQIMGYPFKKQTLSVSADKMEQEREVGLPTNQLDERLQQCTEQSPKQKLWKGPFFIPIELTRVTCEFGTVRTTQEKGRYAHKALDVIGPLKCVVWAPHDGIIVVKDRYVHTGNTVVIDHGLGVLTMLCHLDSFADVSVGDKIRRGNPIGVMGKTGYASGDHVHWEQRLNNIPIDPMQWTKTDF